MRGVLKRFASMMHGRAASHPGIASRYLGLFRSAKFIPDDRWKQHLLSSLQSAKWPIVKLSPARVRLDASIVVTLIPHLEEFDFAAHIYRQLSYEREVMHWLKERSYDLVIEIGANVGIYTLFFSHLRPAAHIYCFEPSRTAYGRLLENLALNDCENVLPFNCAVADQTGFLDFHEPDGHLTNGSLDASFARIFSDLVKSTKVASISGKEVMQLIPKGKKVLVKIDVEGAEPIVLDSLEQLIARDRPDIVIEVLSPTVDALNRIKWLRAYRFFQLDSDGPHERDSFVVGENRDYALIPASVGAHGCG